MSAHPGAGRLGPYQLEEQLGEGGMGVVYRATGPDGRPVAVKALRQGVPAEATARYRLAREVATMRRVHSPFVAEVVDADVEGTPPYIVTRYVAGRTLDQVVAGEGPLTGAALARLAHGLAAALVAVHSAGVVHRDLKPANVMLVDGEPVVIDFGIAQVADSTRLTMTGMFMGTPGYLAPEVIEGKPGGPAADVHSWAATIAFAASGLAPFGTGQFEAIFYRIVHGQPELDRVPPPLLPIVAAAMARDPSRRPTAADLVAMVASLNPETLVPGAAGHLASTSVDLGPPASPAPVWPGTRPIAVPGYDDFADLLPPVRYLPAGSQVPALAAPAAGLAGAAPAGTAQIAAGSAPGGTAWPGADGWPGPGTSPGWDQVPEPGEPGAAGQGRAGAVPPDRRPASAGAGRLAVLAAVTSLVAVSVLLPIAGAVAALALIVALRAADHTTNWLDRRRARQGARRSDPAVAIAFYPLAVCRSALAVLFLAPFALLSAAVVALVAVLADGPAQLPRVGGYAVGAFIASYCIGPGSRACRRPLRRGFDRLSQAGPAAVIGALGAAAMAAGFVAAAATMNPGYWPDVHLGSQLQSAAFAHPAFSHLPGSVTGIGRRLVRWLGL